MGGMCDRCGTAKCKGDLLTCTEIQLKNIDKNMNRMRKHSEDGAPDNDPNREGNF